MPALSEAQFAALVAELGTDPARRDQLTDLLNEDHPVYGQRGTAAIIRMRGWVLLASQHLGLPRPALIYVLEELDNGRDAYLIAAAARVLRSSAGPNPEMARFLVRAITNVRDHDDIVCLRNYGGYSVAEPGTTAVQEILESLRWLGPNGHGVLPELETLRENSSGQFSTLMLGELKRTIEVIRSSAPPAGLQEDDCCGSLMDLGIFQRHHKAGKDASAIGAVIFEDQDGNSVRFNDFFRGRPALVVFFYSRCDNPRKCSLTITKLARVQKMLADRGLEDRIRTAAITYDPQYDLPARLRAYGEDRGVSLDANHRMLRSIEGMRTLQAYFQLGVNFIESLVNRHRIEAYVLNASGEVAGSFERIQWDENEVVDQAARLLSAPAVFREKPAISREILGTAVPLVVAILPKCPMCWAAYLSMFGIAGLRWAPYFRWLFPALISLILINLGSLWLRGFRRGSLLGFYLAASGACAIALGMYQDLAFAGPVGVVLTITGSLLSAINPGAWRPFARGLHPPAA
jgi:protein SCO1/2